MAQFIADIESNETNSEPEEANDEPSHWSKGPVTSNLDYTRDQNEREENTHMNGNKRGKDDTPTDTSTSGDDRRVRRTSNDCMSRKPFDRRPKMRNVRITPVTNGYRHNFLQFSSDVYPDTGCTETVIARSMARRQKMSITPINRQLQRAEGRQWRGSTTFDIEYHGRTLRVEALLSPSLENGIFLG